VLLTDRVDEWLVSNLADFDDKPLLSVARGELDLSDVANADQESDEEEVDESSYAGLIDRLKAVLDDRVKEIRVSHRLTQSPACLVSGDADMGGNLERILRASGQEIQGAKPVFEINPKHPLIDRLQVEQGDQRFSDLALVLFDQALLSEGGQLDDPASFVHRLNDLIIQMSD
jgi:molecular chaperone HtpG